MFLLYLILLVVGFFFPPAWLVFAGIWIYRFASRKSRRAEAMEKILKAMVRTRRDYLDVPSLYFEWARAYAIDKGGGTGGEEDSASVTVVIEHTPYFVVFCRADPAKPGFTISITEHDRIRDDVERFANGQTERFAEDMEKKIASIFGGKQGGTPSSSSESSPMGDRTAPARTAFIGMMDIDDFDAINEKLGRGAGDQVMKAYKRLAATQSKVGSILNETGFMALQDELARTGSALNEFVLCFPYSSGDEFIIQHQDPEKVRSVLESMQRAADELELAIPDDSGATIALLHGIPVSIGCGSTKDEAWRAVIAQKRTGTKKAMSDRIELLNPPPDAPSADGGITDAAREIFRNQPATDPESGLPTTIEITVEESPRGPIPVLMWGPVETRRPGWTKTHHEKMCREIVGHMVSLGIADSSRVTETTEEVAQLSDLVWRNLEQAMTKARSNQG
ncbi:hypothetical protein [Myxococcus sp. RHSTA-1-4]|uniref:GGDEF domain-containing protein n=1 Tax=Myxococcus sp. RHSTA-1-4 TaxID=2874601 RepID=UPI001CBFCE71|nr:hypothetical protein [Myxococcus sp. RHSTA-1-4]MBZ4417866.1 hypothetical protein [Myxococcus sp. RHSTA-1-4]